MWWLPHTSQSGCGWPSRNGTALQPINHREIDTSSARLPSSTLFMVALGNGQWENVAIFPIPAVATALKAGRWAVLSLVSPLCGLLAIHPDGWPPMCGAIHQTTTPNWRLYSSIALVSSLCLAYYRAEDSQTAHIGPALASISEPVRFQVLSSHQSGGRW